MNIINIIKNSVPLIDLRAPMEYQKGALPLSINIPILSDLQREKVGIEVGNLPEFQLYNLKEDVGQQNNLATSNPEKLEELLEIFESLRGEGYDRSVKEVIFR